MKPRLLTILMCLLIGLFASTSHAISLELQPSIDTVFVDEIFTMDLVVSGLTDGGAPSVGAFDLDVTFDPLFFDFVDYSLGPYLGDISMGEALDLSLDPMPGNINLNELSLLDADPFSGPFFIPPYLDEIQPASFSLASLTFQATDFTGESLMEIKFDRTGQGVYDGFGAQFFFEDEDEDIGGSTINVAPVPEPATILLLASGMAGLGVFGRKRFKK